jgi:hypothetical protein
MFYYITNQYFTNSSSQIISPTPEASGAELSIIQIGSFGKNLAEDCFGVVDIRSGTT